MGFASGVGRGVIGLVTKPVVGMFDLASNITAGVRETTTIFDTSDIARERLPRHIGMDGILRVRRCFFARLEHKTSHIYRFPFF